MKWKWQKHLLLVRNIGHVCSEIPFISQRASNLYECNSDIHQYKELMTKQRENKFVLV